MKDYRTFLKLQEVVGNKQAKARRQGYNGNTNNAPSASRKQPTEQHKDRVSQIKETKMREDISHLKDTSLQ
jgi:hypothetical protein